MSYIPLYDKCLAHFGGYLLGQEREICDELKALRFFDAPASTKHHCSYTGGLYDHSSNVAVTLLYLTETLDLNWGRPESPVIIGLFHDLCKCDAYLHLCQSDEYSWAWNDKQLLKGHGDKSVMIASTLMRLTPEEVACIRYHMGAFTDKEEWPDYTHAIHQYPNVLWTHTADMIATHTTNTRGKRYVHEDPARTENRSSMGQCVGFIQTPHETRREKSRLLL